MPLVSFQAYTQTFEMEGAGVCILGYSYRGHRCQNAVGGCKIKECKVILWPNLHDFSNNWPERGTGLVSSFGRSGTPWIFHLHLI